MVPYSPISGLMSVNGNGSGTADFAGYRGASRCPAAYQTEIPG